MTAFVSYSAIQQPIAEDVLRSMAELKEHARSIAIDEVPRERRSELIRAAVEWADNYVIVTSDQELLNDHWIPFEIGCARAARKNVVIVAGTPLSARARTLIGDTARIVDAARIAPRPAPPPTNLAACALDQIEPWPIAV